MAVQAFIFLLLVVDVHGLLPTFTSKVAWLPGLQVECKAPLSRHPIHWRPRPLPSDPQQYASQPLAAIASRAASRSRAAVMNEAPIREASAIAAEQLAPGTVLVAAPGSFDHYFMESLVMILENSDEMGTRGVLLNHEMPWLVEDMNPMLSGFGSNPVFLGGERGRDTMLMLHAQAQLEGAKPLRDSGLYLGGLSAAATCVEEGSLSPDDFKFFYKTSEWLPGQLEKEIGDGLWQPARLHLSWLLEQRGQRDMWEEVRERLIDTQLRSSGLRVQLVDPSKKKKEEERAAAQSEEASADAQQTEPREAAESAAHVAADAGEHAPSARDAHTPAETRAGERRPPAPEGSAAKTATGEVVKVLAYRTFKGAEQWLVRWRSYGPDDDTWERWHMLDSEAVRHQANDLREQTARGSSS